MEWQLRKLHARIVIVLLLVGSIMLTTSLLPIIGVKSNENASESTIAVFYGSVMDKHLSELLVTETDQNAVYYNISAVQADNSFIFTSESVKAIWWISELKLPIDLTFVGNINEWKEAGRGLFVLNRFFQQTPLQDLNHLGITTYAPIVYPLNESNKIQEISLIKDNLPMLNLTQTTFDFNGSTAWVEVDKRVQMLAEVITPSSEPVLKNLTSGIWMEDDRVIIGSFSLDIETESSESGFRLQSESLSPPEDIIDVLGQIVQLTLGCLPSNTGLIQFGGFEQILIVGFIVIASLFSFFVLIKVGIISKIRDYLIGVLMGFFLFIAHVAYSPQRRRISETELLENELRSQILGYLGDKGEQGAHLREIQREVGCGISSLLWHLQALDDFNLVTHEKIGKYHIFYLTGEKSIQTSEISLALKSNVAKELCRVLIKRNKPVTLSKISQEIDVHHSSVQHHIKKLAELGIILIIKEKRRAMYTIAPKRTLWLKDMLEVA
ncbi:MAG: helix-turn-helix domain-containing protein [Candidatus Hodarchaeota archaeon]